MKVRQSLKDPRMESLISQNGKICLQLKIMFLPEKLILLHLWIQNSYPIPLIIIDIHNNNDDDSDENIDKHIILTIDDHDNDDYDDDNANDKNFDNNDSDDIIDNYEDTDNNGYCYVIANSYQ